MEKGLTHTIYTVKVLEGHTDANVDRLAQILLQNASNRLSNDPSHTNFEDSFCPNHPVIDKIVDDMQEVYPHGRLSLDDKWGHIHEKNMSSNRHDHANFDLSGVVYLQVPKGCGQIVFWPNPIHEYRYTIPPKKGLFLLFPGWVPHCVTRNLSSEPRVSISMNFNVNLEES